MKRNLVTLLCISTLSGPVFADAAQCTENFSVEGSFFTGKLYKTWADFPAAKTDQAFKKLYAFTVKGGWKVSQADKDLGVISAAQDVSFGNGKTAPLNIIVEKNGNGVKVSMTYATSGGVSSPEDAVKNHFCNSLAEVEKK